MNVEPRSTAGVERGRRVTFHFDGEPVAAYEGETVAVALWATGRRTVRRSSREGAPRALFCNMGICYECLVRIGEATVRACMTPVSEGLQVRSGGRE